MVIRMADGTTTTFDYREKAPAKSAKDMFLDDKGNYVPEKSQEGYLACGVPGSVAGMLLAHEKFGRTGFGRLSQIERRRACSKNE